MARGAYRLHVEGPGVVPAELRHVRIPGPEVSLVVARRVRIAGVVIDSGAPAAGAEVEVGGTALADRRSVTVGADGRFELADLPEGSYALAARRGVRATLVTGVERFGGGPWLDLVVALAPAGLVGGRVVDGTTGAPVAGARVILVPADAEAGDAAVRRVRSDSAGAFTAEGLPPGPWTIDVDAPGYLPPGRRPVDVVEGERTSVDVSLNRGAVVSGRVVDSTGAPVAGAAIELAGQDDGGRPVAINALARARRLAWASGTGGSMGGRRLVPGGELGVMVGPIPYPPPRGALPTMPAGADRAETPAGLLTGADGGFRIDGVPPGTYVAHAAHDSYAPGESEPLAIRSGTWEVTGVSLVLRRGARLVGRVSDEQDVAVPGAEVSLKAGPRTLAMTFTDEDGRFAFEHATDAVTVYASARGFGAAQQDLLFSAEDEGKTFEQSLVLTSAGGLLAGRVYDSDRRPVGGVEVLASGPGDTRGRALTGDDGRFVLRGLVDGLYQLEARRGDFPPARLTGVRPGSEDIELVLRPGGGVHGLVLDAQTLGGLRSFQVRAHGPEGAELTRTFSRGQLDLVPLASGRWQLIIEAAGYATSVVTVDVPEGRSARSTTVPDLRIELAQGATVAGTVYDEHGETVAGATVEAGLVRTTTDAHGDFRLAGVAPGDQPIRARHPRSGAGERVVALRSGDEVLTVEIKLSAQ